MTRRLSLAEKIQLLSQDPKYQTGHECAECGAFMPDRYFPTLDRTREPYRYITLCWHEIQARERQAAANDGVSSALAEAERTAARATALIRSGLVDRAALQTFAAFDASRQPEAVAQVARFLDGRGWRVLVLSSPPSAGFEGFGCGKSHLAAAACHVDAGIGGNPLIVSVRDLLDRVKATYGDQGEETEAAIIGPCQTASLLALDDWGKETLGMRRNSDGLAWSQATLYGIVDARYRRGLPVLVTTNLPATAFMAHVGGAVASRIGESVVWVTMRPGDFRTEKP